MQTYTHKQSGERRLPTPSWAVNDAELRELLCHYMEARLRIRAEGTLEERRARIALAAQATRPVLEARLNGLNLEYVRAKRSGAKRARLKELEIEIENLDTQLRTLDSSGGMTLVASIVYLYYRTGLDSVGVAGQLGLKPPHVRQVCYRLDHLWEKKRRNGLRLTRQRSCAPVNRKGGVVTASDKWDLAHAMHADGRHYSEIAKEIGVTFGVMWKVLLMQRTGPFRGGARRK